MAGTINPHRQYTSRNYTPFAFYSFTEANRGNVEDPSSSDTYKEVFNNLPAIDLRAAESGFGNNHILINGIITANNKSDATTPYVEEGLESSSTFDVTLYMQTWIMVQTTDSEGNTSIEPVSKWVKVESISGLNCNSINMFTSDLYAGIYKIWVNDVTTTSAPDVLANYDAVGLTLNYSFNDEPGLISRNIVEGAYGDENSILPPSQYVVPGLKPVQKRATIQYGDDNAKNGNYPYTGEYNTQTANRKVNEEPVIPAENNNSITLN